MIKIVQNSSPVTEAALAKASHMLFVLPKAKSLADDLPGVVALRARLARRRMKPDDLAKTPLSGDLEPGGLAAWVMLDEAQTPFERHALIRKALQPLLAEHPKEVVIAVFGGDEMRRLAAEAGVYTVLVNSAALPQRKKKNENRPLQKITLHGYEDEKDFAALRSQAEGNVLARELTILPANELTPGLYRERIRKLARENGWKCDEFDMKKLRKIGAGAFVAVAQGSSEEDAAIVRLRYRHPQAKKTVALVGKGICFDTGGHNLKPARYMHGMHEDMNGSAVSLGLLLAASRAKLPLNIDCWLALAQNHISPEAYKQGDVVTALNGTTIEIVHTDAEGRMVLADTLTLAAREKPDLIVDFATLTGSMATALGARCSGIFANRDRLVEQAVAAGKCSGERVCAFPLDADYEEGLESQIADIKQCTMEGEADHILAARFLMRFIGERPWLHVDLSASNCKGGLGAVASDVNGFGVGWGMALLRGMSLLGTGDNLT
ncbi:MAG: leucyl aminopeptidase family protein [Sulfuricella sp.]|nr:leucyl aminopeptidase family protein [Sulfuricella sp.]